MTLTPAFVLQYLEERHISIWAVARRMESDSTHLRRVLTGRREGSQELLRAVLENAQAMPTQYHRRNEDATRLFEAAAHVFFLKRGDFESAIFADPEEMGLYGPGPTRKRAQPEKNQKNKPRKKYEKNER